MLQIHKDMLSFSRIQNFTKITSSHWKTCDFLELLTRTCFSLVYTP